MSANRNNSSFSTRNSSNEEKEDKSSGAFGVGAIILTAGIAALAGGIFGLFASSNNEEKPQVHVQRTVPVQPPTECSICFDALGSRPLELLPCSHLFHLSCLTEWLRVGSGQSGKSCPICRQPLTRSQLQIYSQRCGL